MKKYFDILELDASATIEAVEQAYKELSNAWRPENYQNLPRYRRKAEARLREINEAYERLKSYLAARPHLEVHNNKSEAVAAPDEYEPQPAPPQTDQEQHTIADRVPEAEPEPETDREVGPPPWEPELPDRPAADISRPQIQKTVQKSLIFGFVAIVAVLGVLQLFRMLDRSKATEPKAQKSQSMQVASRRPAAEKQQTRAAKTARQQKPPSVATTPDSSAAPAAAGIDYQKALSLENLSPYNRNPARVRRIQKSLRAEGYDTGPVDGIIGPHTSRALQQFANDHDIGAENLFAPDLPAAVILYTEVAAEHPDWHRIAGSEDFARWLDSQTYYPANRIRALKNSATAGQVSDMLELYKLERNMQSN